MVDTTLSHYNVWWILSKTLTVGSQYGVTLFVSQSLIWVTFLLVVLFDIDGLVQDCNNSSAIAMG